MKLSIRRGNKQAAINSDDIEAVGQVAVNINEMKAKKAAYIKISPCLGEWQWILFSGNHSFICESDFYKTRSAAKRGAQNLSSIVARGIEVIEK